MTVGTFRDLAAWQRGMDLIKEVYDLTESFPRDERHALSHRLQLAAMEGPALLARGYGAGRCSYFARCIQVAHGALMEVDTFLEIAEHQGYVSQDRCARINGEIETIARLLRKLFREVRDNTGPAQR